MPTEPTDAWKLADGKLSIPSELRTAEVAALPQWLRERIFYMAGVAHAETLDEFRREVESIAAGGASIPEAERRLSELLVASGYKPLPGQEGTIKDLRSWRRMRVALRTNVELLQGWGQKQRGLTRAGMMAFPAWELIRVMPRSAPRNWDGNAPSKQDPAARWTLAGGTFYAGRMIALKDSPVWLELGSFSDGLGVDYPPFAWGSGMGWKAIGFREAKALGVLPEGWMPPPRQPAASPNATLQSKPEVTDAGIREDLARRLQGLAEWRDDVLVFTDPNGSRPYPAAKVAEVITAKLPDGFRNIAADAVKAWAKDSLNINLKRGRNITDDFARTVARIEPLPPATPVWRGERFGSEADLLLRLAELLSDTGAKVVEAGQSWTRLPGVAGKFSRLGNLPCRLVLHSKRHSSLRFIQPLIKKIFPKYWKQAEVVSLEGAKWRAVGEPIYVRTRYGLEIQLEVEEL